MCLHYLVFMIFTTKSLRRNFSVVSSILKWFVYFAAFFFFLPPSSPPSSGVAAASLPASSAAAGFSSSIFSSPPLAMKREHMALQSRKPTSSILNSPKMSSTSAAENLSPHLVRAHLRNQGSLHFNKWLFKNNVTVFKL